MLPRYNRSVEIYYFILFSVKYFESFDF